MKSLIFAFVLIALLGPRALGQQGNAPLKRGTWSSAAWDINMRPVRIFAPDDHTVFVEVPKYNADGDSTPDIFVEQDGNRLPGQITVDVDPEMAWSPDSKAFFITSSDGGAVGTFGTIVYLVEDGKVRSVDITKQVRDDIAARYPACVAYKGIQSCTLAEQHRMARNHDWVNVAGMKWLKGSTELLVVGNVPDSSGYGANMTEWMGYRIEIPSGKILERYTANEFRKKWNELKPDWN